MSKNPTAAIRIQIDQGNGQEWLDVVGERIGLFLIHRQVLEGGKARKGTRAFVVSHIPTGLMMPRTWDLTIAQARALASSLVGEHWARITTENAGDRTTPDMRAAGRELREAKERLYL